VQALHLKMKKMKPENPKPKEVSFIVVVGSDVYRYSPSNKMFLIMDVTDTFNIKYLDNHLLTALKGCKENGWYSNSLFIIVINGRIHSIKEIFEDSDFKIPKSRKFRRSL
jgi:hypothetical protein